MSTVERAQAILGDPSLVALGDPSLVALREWEDLNGELGVYHSQAHDSYDLFILIPSADQHSTQSYPATDRDKAIHLAECIAAFAGAQERFP